MNVKRIITTVILGGTALLVLTAGGCPSNSNDAQEKYSNEQGQAAINKWGNPNITNFNEYKLAKEVTEQRDRTDLVMFAYLQGNDGSLRCYGKVVGYGIPYSTQITPPDQPTSSGAQEPVREPNGLFMPQSAEATWIRVVGPDGKTYIEYIEPRLVVSPIERPCKQLNE